MLAQQFATVGGLGANDEELTKALREYEKMRLKRATPLAVRSRFVGAVLQVPYWPVRLFLVLILHSTWSNRCPRGLAL